MSQFTKFMKTNKKVRENGFYAPTKSLCDEDGKPLEWEFRHITSGENESIREECTIEVQVKGKPNLYRPRVQTGKYIRKMIVESVVVPDLLDRELQNSYGGERAEDLLLAMVDDPGENNDLAAFVQKFQGFDTSFEDKVNEAKN